MIRVFVINQSHLICSIMTSALSEEEDIQVIGSATDATDGLRQLRGLAADVTLVSTNLNHDVALHLAEALRETEGTKVLILGVAESEDVILRYAHAGVAGYVLREDTIDKLVESIRAAHRGEALVSPHVAGALLTHIANLAANAPQPEHLLQSYRELTSREEEVLQLIGEGLTNKEIADRLVIEVGTVKNHVHRILHKLDVSSREDAAGYWEAVQNS